MGLRNAWYFSAGIAFLALAKAKHVLAGYSTPKPFDLSDIARCVDYDLQVVDGWMRALASYVGSGTFLAGKHVLELGPGSDLGVGLTLLARGARAYEACDVHDLATHAPEAFYEALLARLAQVCPEADMGVLRGELEKARTGAPSRLGYRVRRDFDLTSAVGRAAIDIVVSQAAFEHFDDVERVVDQLTEVCRPGAVLVAEVDLKTHSRWIRDRDPNNIYRYPDFLYEAFRFRGIPNRVRPFEYRAAFERRGWTKVTVTPLTRGGVAAGTPGSVARKFASPLNQMDFLTILLCATKGP